MSQNLKYLAVTEKSGKKFFHPNGLNWLSGFFLPSSGSTTGVCNHRKWPYTYIGVPHRCNWLPHLVVCYLHGERMQLYALLSQ
ncbi:hypothetical protein GDO78_007712 [Eleutherodactylus coqui]|uniref:Uncharacterized protein n=1 Tax=Eleutherodactylus coqui TaxID=57060 RepID=A0A8J6FK07_ELECQ|nr:hypothetical protein GDO78_007712 [Eleutherodactylus coqui]